MKKLMILLAILLSGCASLVTNPEVTVKDVSIVGLDTNGVDLEFYLNIKNPNPFGVTLKGYSYDVQVMTLPVARGGSRNTLAFKPNGVTDMRLPVRVLYRDLVEILKRRPDPDSIPYRLTAGLELDSAVGELLVPLEKSDTFAVPQEYRPAWLMRRTTEMIDRMWQ